jgi:FkbM family methyltransferase
MRKRLQQRLAKRVKQNRYLHSAFYIPLKARRFLQSMRAGLVERRYRSIVGSMAYGTVAVPLNDFGGVFELDIRSDILKRIILEGEYEKDHLSLVEEYLDSDRDVIDIGANCGLFSVFFAKHVAPGRRVLAIEPTPNALRLLGANLQGNSVADSVIVYRGVAASAPGVYDMKVVAGKEEYSTLGGSISPTQVQRRMPEELAVPGNTVDALVEELGLVPGFIKIDTEGAEYLVLQGAQTTLRLHQPVILSELVDDYLVHFGHSARQVVEFLSILGYTVKDVSTDEPPVFPFTGHVLAVAASVRHGAVTST